MASPFLISRPNADTLVLEKSKMYSILAAVGILSFWIAWYSIYFQANGSPFEVLKSIRDKNIFVIFMGIAPLLGIFEIFKSIKNLINPRIIEFDKVLRKIRDDKKESVYFDDVEYIQIKVIKDSDGPNEYALSLSLKDNKKLRIEKDKSEKEIFKLADEISDFLKLKIQKTS